MKEFILTVIWFFGVAGISVIGVLSAFWPINDKPTTLAHKIFYLVVVTGAIMFWNRMFA